MPQFIEQAVRRQIELRKANAAFQERGVASHQITQQTKRYIDADVVLGKLRARLEAAFGRQLK